jgi:hypothetical protein
MGQKLTVTESRLIRHAFVPVKQPLHLKGANKKKKKKKQKEEKKEYLVLVVADFDECGTESFNLAFLHCMRRLLQFGQGPAQQVHVLRFYGHLQSGGDMTLYSHEVPNLRRQLTKRRTLNVKG